MSTPVDMRELALFLLNHEAAAGAASTSAESAVLRVYGKLRRILCALAGVTGFRSLASRALTLAKWEAPSLGLVQVTADGHLQGPIEFDQQIDGHQAGEGEVALIAQLLGLLFIFIGESLTLRMLQEEWPRASVEQFRGREE